MRTKKYPPIGHIKAIHSKGCKVLNTCYNLTIKNFTDFGRIVRAKNQ